MGKRAEHKNFLISNSELWVGSRLLAIQRVGGCMLASMGSGVF